MSRFFPKLDEDGLPIRTNSNSFKTEKRLDELIANQLSQSMGLQKTDDEGQITTRWTDPLTKMTQDIKEKPAKGPEGDFRVSPQEADSLQKMKMGLPLKEIKRNLEETVLADNVLEDSDIQQSTKEYTKRRETIQRLKVQNALSGHREKMDDSLLDSEEKQLQIRDLPIVEKNRNQTASPTECQRGLESSEVSTKILNLPQLGATDLRNQTESSSHGLIEDTLLKRDNVKSVQASAYRSLVGFSGHDLQVLRSESERTGRKEDDILVHLAITEGLVAAPNATEHREDTKRDQLAYHIGRRAIENIVAKAQCPEYLELPLAQRDTVALAVGRTLVTFAETSVGLRKPAETMEVSQKYERLSQARPTVMHAPAGMKSKADSIEASRRSENVLRLQVRGHADIGQKTPAELQEAMQNRDNILRQLVKIDQADLVKQVLKPELIHVSQKQDTLNSHISNASLQGPEFRAHTEIIARKNRSEAGSRAQRPVQDSVMNERQSLALMDTSSKVPRDVTTALQRSYRN